jgi:hypothetical protein
MDTTNIGLPAYILLENKIRKTIVIIYEFGDRDPNTFLSPSKIMFKDIIQDIDIELQKAQIKNLEHAQLQDKIRNK